MVLFMDVDPLNSFEILPVSEDSILQESLELAGELDSYPPRWMNVIRSVDKEGSFAET
jgi:hypothetical protein